MQELVTIGGYSLTETSFLETLNNAKVSAFADIRQRRGMLGSRCAFLNSERLQASMQRADIRYLHVKELVPTSLIRGVQKVADKEASTSKRSRTRLSNELAEAYRREILASFDSARFDALVGADTEVVALGVFDSVAGDRGTMASAEST